MCVCADIDECQTGLADCFTPAHCDNEAPGYRCSCMEGWTGDGRTCTGTVVVVVVVVAVAAAVVVVVVVVVAVDSETLGQIRVCL